MTKAVKRVERESQLTVRDSGKERAIIVSIEPGAAILGFRAKGTRRTYYLPVNALHDLAVKKHLEAEKRDKMRRGGKRKGDSR